MSDPSELWISLLPQKTDEQKPASKRHDYCRKVLDLLSEKHPDLLTGKPGAVLTPEEAQLLVDTLQKNTPGHIFKHQVDYLIRGLEKGTTELGWNVAIPEAPVVIPRDTPRFTLDSFSALPEVYTVLYAFLEDLKRDLPKTRTARVGQLLLSAILFGALVKKRWLAPWVVALPKAVSVGPQLLLDMVYSSAPLERELKKARKSGKIPKDKKTKPDHSGVKEEYEIHRRWFADPLTHALILRWRKDFPEDLDTGRDVSPIMAIQLYLDGIVNPELKTSESFVLSLLKGSATRIGLGVPTFLLQYAEGVNKSVSLPLPVWERLVTGKRVITPQQNTIDEDENVLPVAEPLAIPEVGDSASLADQEKMLDVVLRDILSPTNKSKRLASDAREALQAFLRDKQGEMVQALSLLILWSIDLLTHYSSQDLIRGRKKSSIRASSVNSYLSTIGKRLITVAKKTDLLRLGGADLHDVYRDTIDLCPTHKSKNKAGTRLHSFHQFISIRLNAPKVDFSDLGVRSGPAESAVDANLLSFDSFDRLKITLCPNYQAASRIRKIQYLVAIIAFRCGLREMEILKLRIIDFQGHTEPELLIRTNRYSYVKSADSVRRIPLACLLEADELKLLLDWRYGRVNEDDTKTPQSLLFCSKDKPDILLSVHEVISPIVKALRQVTGDSSLVFHHFRHSFTTWLLLRLLKNFTPEDRKRFHFLGHHLFDHSSCEKLRKSILGNHRLGRQVVFATAQLCGHGSPEVTLLHYFHLCDWLLGLELMAIDKQPVLDFTTIKIMTGIEHPDGSSDATITKAEADRKKHALYYYKRRCEPWRMSFVLEWHFASSELKSQSTLEDVDTTPIPEKDSDHQDDNLPFWRRVFSAIRERQIGRMPYDVLAIRSGFKEEDIKTWCKNTETLAAMKTKRGKPRHVNGVTSRNNPTFRFPQPLRLKEDRDLAQIILNCFEKSRGKKKLDIIRGVRRYISNYSVSEGGINCNTPKEVKDYASFMKSLNIPPEQIHVTRIRPRTSRLTPEVEQKRLAIRVGLPTPSISVRSLYAQEYSRTGYYVIQVKNARVDIRAKLMANYGFRFAMYMIAIVEGLE